jgi:hypothetical protein
MHWEVINAHELLVQIPHGKRQVWRPRDRWQENMKIVIKEIHCEVWNWIVSI